MTTETKKTPMQMVKHVYPTAKAVKVDNGWYIANFVGNSRYALSDVRASANVAWSEAAKDLSPVEVESDIVEGVLFNKFSKRIEKAEKKLSRRRRRIIHKIETGEYIQKTPEQSLNIAFRCFS